MKNPPEVNVGDWIAYTGNSRVEAVVGDRLYLKDRTEIAALSDTVVVTVLRHARAVPSAEPPVGAVRLDGDWGRLNETFVHRVDGKWVYGNDQAVLNQDGVVPVAP